MYEKTYNYTLKLYYTQDLDFFTQARDYNESNQTAHDILNKTPEHATYLLRHNIYFSIGFVLTMLFAYLQRSFFESKLLKYLYSV